MTLREAISLADSYGRVRRPHWHEGFYWAFDGGGVLCEYRDGHMLHAVSIERGDVAATDYEEAPPPKSTPYGEIFTEVKGGVA